MNTQLPLFEGRKVEGATLKLTGKSTDQIGALSHDERVFLIVRGTVAKVSHGDTKVGDATVFAREHTVKADRVVLVSADDGERMLAEALMIADERFGLSSIFVQPSGPDGETGEVAS